MNKIDPYKNELLAGVSAVVVGFLLKKIFKKEMLPVSDARKMVETFVVVSVCAGLGEELDRQIRIYQSPTSKL